jgi:hypothetical protein
MQLAALRHTKMAEELATFQAAVSSTVESVLERSPNEIFHMEVVDELVSKFQRLEERLSRLGVPSLGLAGVAHFSLDHLQPS